MIPKEEVIAFLKKVNLFKNLSDEEFGVLPEVCKLRALREGELLFQQNTERNHIYIIYDGEVQLFVTTPRGEDKKITVFGKYDFLGEGSIMDDSPHSTSAKAEKDTIAFVLNNNEILNLFEKHSSLGVKIFTQIAKVVYRRIRFANTKLTSTAAQYASGVTRTEHDLLGDREVPLEAYYGIQTLRATENFNISGITISFFPVIIRAFAMVKMAAARANFDLGHLNGKIKDAIVQACSELINKRFQNQFVVDMIQGGAGTSTNMNVNEVVANRASEILGFDKGNYEKCHPNNHVNLAQSTNDAYPTAIKIALFSANRKLITVLLELVSAFKIKSREFDSVIKMGRTQLQDAVPMTLGQTFGAFYSTLKEEAQRLEQVASLFLSINMGGTAIGTGINSDPEYPDTVLVHLRDITGFDLKLADDLVEATQDTGAFVMYSSAIKRLAVKLSKICNDLRLLSSGPRAGFNEINLPKMQPGSSIMPGKVNPVIPEVVNQVAFKVIGNDLTVTLAAEAGQLELNVFEPVIAQSLFENIEMLKNGMKTLTHRCIRGITANETICRQHVEGSIGTVTVLNPILGYEKSTIIAKKALETGKGVYDLVLEEGYMTKEELDKYFSPDYLLKPHK